MFQKLLYIITKIKRLENENIEFKEEVFEIILFTKEKVFDIIDKKKKAHKLIFNMLKSHEKKIDGLKKVLDEVTSKNCK